MNQYEIHLVEDDEAVRDAVRLLLGETGLSVVDHSSALEFLSRADFSRIACLVLDLQMPGMTGLELLEELDRRDRRVPALVITGYGDVPTAVRAMKLGAIDFFEKPLDNQVLLDRVKGLISQTRQAHHRAAEIRRYARRLEDLTVREREILGMAAEGLLNKEIAYQLNISPRTVEVHRANIRKKLGVDRWAELLRMTVLATSDSDSPS